MIHNQRGVCFENINPAYSTTCIVQRYSRHIHIFHHSTATQFVTPFHIMVRNPLPQKQNKQEFSKILTHANIMSSILNINGHAKALNKETNGRDSRQGRGGAEQSSTFFQLHMLKRNVGILNWQNHQHRNERKKATHASRDLTEVAAASLQGNNNMTCTLLSSFFF